MQAQHAQRTRLSTHGTRRYSGEWEKTVRRIGRWIDFGSGYKTMDASFMESVWWVFKRLWDEGLVYQGHKVGPLGPLSPLRPATPWWGRRALQNSMPGCSGVSLQKGWAAERLGEEGSSGPGSQGDPAAPVLPLCAVACRQHGLCTCSLDHPHCAQVMAHSTGLRTPLSECEAGMQPNLSKPLNHAPVVRRWCCN